MAKIEPGKPLPGHTKLSYEECYAKIILETLFPERYNNLAIADKPDLRDPSDTVGIEVTSATPSQKKESERLWYTMPYVTPQAAERNKERMEQLGVPYTGGVQAWPAIVYHTGCFEESPFVGIVDVFNIKLKKLNCGRYADLERYDLYIEAEWHLDTELLPEILARITKLNSAPRSFHFVYLACVNGVCSFDLVQKELEVRKLAVEQYELAMAARNLVERAENDDEA